jgi:hypothetical protein
MFLMPCIRRAADFECKLAQAMELFGDRADSEKDRETRRRLTEAAKELSKVTPMSVNEALQNIVGQWSRDRLNREEQKMSRVGGMGSYGVRMLLGEIGAEIEVEGSWTIERDMIPCDSITPEPDPRWSFTDQEGHEHRWQRWANAAELKEHGDWELPTLEYVVTGVIGCDDGCGQVDEIDVGEWRCLACRQVIEPGTRMPEPGRMIGGPMRWSAKVLMSEKELGEMPREYMTDPVKVQTPMGWGRAYMMGVTPHDSLGIMYEVKLRGIGGLGWDVEEKK